MPDICLQPDPTEGLQGIIPVGLRRRSRRRLLDAVAFCCTCKQASNCDFVFVDNQMVDSSSDFVDGQ
jgi:hypothetical protein